MSEQIKTLISTVVAILGTQIPGLSDVIQEAGGTAAVIAAGATLTGLIRGLWHLVDSNKP